MGAQRSLGSFLGPALLAAAGFVAVAGLARPWVPPPAKHQLEARLAHLATNATGYDLLFFGSSTIRRGFQPEVFDAELARLGHPLRSFNMGVPGAYPFELDYLIAKTLAETAHVPRWVAIEPSRHDLDDLISEQNRFSDRAVHWHDSRQLADLLRAMARDGGERSRFVEPLTWHLRHALWRYTSLGQGPRIVTRPLRKAQRAREAEALSASRGFEPLAIGPEQPVTLSRRKLLEHPEAYGGVVRSIDRRNAQPPSGDVDPAKLRRQVATVRAAGAEPIYVLGPGVQRTNEIRYLHRAGVLPHLVAFDSPARYPELYALRHRYDEIHLNEEGARLFSLAFAGQFVRWLESGDR